MNLKLKWIQIVIMALATVLKVITGSNYSGCLQNLSKGPLYRTNMAVYSDQVSILQQFMLSDILLESSISHFLVDINSVNPSDLISDFPGYYFKGDYFVHLVFIEDTEKTLNFLSLLSDVWVPRRLILFSLSIVNLAFTMKETLFSKIEQLVTFQSRDLNRSIEFFTYFPFSDKIEKLGSCTSDVNNIFVDRFPTFEGYEFMLSTWFDDFPFLYNNTNNSSLGVGMNEDMVRAIAKRYDFSYSMTNITNDEMWGDFENGTWNGMLGWLHTKEKNFTINYFTITELRTQYFDASTTYWMEGFGITALIPRQLPKWRNVYYPFSSTVWMCIGLTIVTAVLAMIFQDIVLGNPFRLSSKDSWICVLSWLFNQSYGNLPTGHWQRIIMAFWQLFSFLIVISYTSSLVAYLTIPVYPKRMETVKQLAKSPQRVTMVDYGEFVPAALMSSSDPDLKVLGKKLDLQYLYTEALANLVGGTHVFVESASYNMIYMKTTFDDIDSYIMKEQLYPSHLVWYFQKNTPWKVKFNNAIQNLVENGLVVYWFKHHTEVFMGIDWKKKELLEQREKKLTPLTLDHLQGAFWIYCIGCGLAVLLLILEIKIASIIKKRQSQTAVTKF